MVWSPLEFRDKMRSLRMQEEEMAAQNPYLAQALEDEKMEGHRLAVIARTVALVLVMILLPVLNSRVDVLYYEAIILVFIALGWLQYRMAKVGYSGSELALIFFDLVLLTLVFVTPNPFMKEALPTAFQYRFDNFVYFYLLLAVATLAYSWRTVWAMGTWVTVLWLAAAGAVALFGRTVPELTTAAREAFSGYDLIAQFSDPNALNIGLRIQEVILFLIVAGILAVKGFRSNRLLMQQAEIASERANLSRYFPSSLVDSLASTNHDVGAVRSEEVAVLFTDIVGFTQFAERNSPEEVMELLRRYHAMVELAVFENKGTLEKYMGDGVMATFGRPERTAQDAVNAIAAARQLMEANEAFNAERKQHGKEPVEISVGIHYGPVIMGDIGPERRLEFAVVGDTVNVAARLEAESRALKCHCVVSDDVFKHVAHDWPDRESLVSSFVEKGEVQLRGRSKPISVWVA